MSSSDGGIALTLRNVLREQLPPLSRQGMGLRHDPIAAEVEQLTLRYGAAASDRGPPPDTFAEIKAALEAGAAGVERLPPACLRHVPHVLLYNRVGRADAAVIDTYLGRLREAGSLAPRRLWTHYLLSLEDDDLATVRIGVWLRSTLSMMPERLQEFTSKYDVVEPTRTHVLMAAELLKGDSLAEDFERIGLTFGRVLTSALMASILGSMGRLLRDGANPAWAAARVNEVFGASAHNALEQTQAREEVRRRALVSFIEGFVAWQRRIDPADTKPDSVLDLLITVNMDPRFSPGRWRGVNSSTVGIVEKWLTRQTIEAFFRVVNRLQTNRPDMWEDRRKFWFRYVNEVSKAWLIVGDDALPLAKEERIRFGRFRDGADPKHCGLMMEIDDLRVLEMNMNGRAILWRPAKIQHRVFPEFNEAQFDRGALTSFVQQKEIWTGGVIGLAHMSGWQRKFADHIQQNTQHGIRPKGL